MRRFFLSASTVRGLWAAVPLVIFAAGCGIETEGVSLNGNAAGTSSGGGRGGASGQGGSVSLAGNGGTGVSGTGGSAGQGGSASGEGGASGGTAGRGGSSGAQGGDAGASGAGTSAGEGGASGSAGESGSAGASQGGNGGDAGAAGSAGSAGAVAGNAGTAGVAGSGGLGGAGASGGAGSGGDAGAAGTAGSGGNAGTAGSGGVAGAAGAAGAAGSAGNAGAAGVAGAGGAAGQGPELCGNGRIDPGESCDDGSGPPGSPACKACQVPCDAATGITDGSRCYFRIDTVPADKGTIAADVRAQRAGQPYTMCAAEGAHVASLGGPTEDSSAFLDKLGVFFGTSPTKQLLVGVLLEDGSLNSSDDDKEWIWLDGTVPSASRWDGDNPDADSGGAACGTLMNKRLNDLPCDSGDLKGILCEREPRCAVTAGNESKTPLVGYLSPDNHCWIALPNKVNWAAAIDACGKLKFLDGSGTGTIAVFDKKRLADLPGIGMFDTWVGAVQADAGPEDTDAQKRAGWTWITGAKAYDGNTAMWEPNKPNDKSNGTEDVASLTDLRLLDDDQVTDNKRPLCEVTPP